MLSDKKKIFFTILIIFFITGVFLRGWHFSDWLHFELDQSRDAIVVDLAVEHGIGNLPLLGPKAAGSFLRLGPIFYYFEYLGAKIFGDTPAGLAALNLIFSCLTLPLFYLFARRYFNQKISAALLLLFSTSIFMVMYSRFAWNPNSLPFFILGFFYALLRAVDRDEPRRGWWLVGSAAMLAIATQLHFVALLALPIIAGIFLIFRRPRINWKFWLAAIFLVIFFYLPPIINDFKTDGENIAEFEKVFSEKSSDSDHTLPEKIIRGAEESALGYFLILSGHGKASLPKIRLDSPTGSSQACDAKCLKNLPWGVTAAIILLAGIFFLGRNLIRRHEQSTTRQDFLVLMLLWLVISGILFVPIAYDLAPRFFLLVAPLAFILPGFIFEFLQRKKLGFVVWVIIGLLLFSNLRAIQKRFSELGKAPRENIDIESDKILKENRRVTLEQQLLITDHIENIYRQNGYPVYVNSEAFFRRAFLYHLEKRGIRRDDFRNTQKVYANGNYFLIYPTSTPVENYTYKYLLNFEIQETNDFGTLRVVRLNPLDSAINATEQIFGPENKPVSAMGVPVRCRWNEVLRECNPDEPEDTD